MLLIVETIAMKKAKEQSTELDQKLKKIDEMNAKTVKERAEVELLKYILTLIDIRDSDDFHNWAEEQPQWVQNALYENEMMQNLQQELLTSTNQIEALARRQEQE